MGKQKTSAFESLIDVFKFVSLILLMIIVSALIFYGLHLEKFGYDAILQSRLNENSYFGVLFKDKFEIWKVDKKKDGAVITRIYPQ